MKSATRLFGIGLVCVIVFVCISSVLAFSRDGQGTQLARWLLFEARRSEALQQRRIEVQESEEEKTAISEQFIAGRLSLREAAEQFREVDAVLRENPSSFVASYITPETEHGLCRQVCHWTEFMLIRKHSAREAEQVRRRMEREFHELFPSEAAID